MPIIPIFTQPYLSTQTLLGVPISGAKIYIYEAGTSTPRTVFSDNNGKVEATQPLTADNYGVAKFWLRGGYVKIKVDDADDNEIRVIDNIYVLEVSTFMASLLRKTSIGQIITALNLGTAAFEDVAVDPENPTALDVLQFTSTGIYPVGDGSNIFNLDYNNLINVPASTGILGRGYLSGFAFTRASTTELTMGAGACRDKDDSTDITSSSAITKSTAPFVAGTGNGGGTDGAGIATNVLNATSPTWFIWAIKKDSDGSTDIMFAPSTSADPTPPTGFTEKRYIGSWLVNGSDEFTDITVIGDEWILAAPTSHGGTIATTPADQTLGTPNNRVVLAKLTVSVSGTNGDSIYIYNKNVNDADATPIVNESTATSEDTNTIYVYTNSSREVRSKTSSTSISVGLVLHGWIDRRGRDD